VTAAALLMVAGAAPAGASTAVPHGFKQISYLGHQFSVPQAWPVVNLAAHPHACVRFDQHAVYLGTPGAEEDCPGHAVGRTGALLVQPTP
jgi:hypothetical protein